MNHNTTSMFDDIGDLGATPGSRLWVTAVLLETKACLANFESDAKHTGGWIRSLKGEKSWEALGLASWPELLARLGLSKYEADALMRAESGKTRDLLKSHAEAGAGGGRGNKAPTNGRGFKYGGNTDYTKARLARDRPDLLTKVESGELSANAAAIEAGFRQRMMQVPADDLHAAIEKIKSHYGVKKL